MAILDIEEAAKFLKMKRRSLEGLVREGKVPGTRLIGKWIFSSDQLTQLVESNAMNDAESAALSHSQSDPTQLVPVKKTRRRNLGPSDT